ncbi:MAG: class I SAM-dependent methyltransferase [Pirellulales bacterium]|nr:class I SAM-dependent methyltransferase [Pirellulales bacterium]
MSERGPLGDLADVYDALVDWPKRLAREAPFYRGLFESLGARRVLDAACGTGRHAAMFHAWGLAVEGADLSPGMIERARRAFGEPEGLRFVVRAFDEPIGAEEPFDAVVCVGNSLALAPDGAVAARAVEAMLAAVRPGGAVVIHVLNLDALPDGPCVWQKCLRIALARGDALVAKAVHRSGERGFVELLVVPWDRPEARQIESVPLLRLTEADLERAARRAGAAQTETYGGYAREPFDPRQSTDLIFIARR